MKWAGHMVRMKDEKLPKRSETMKHDGCRKRGRPQLRMGGLCEERHEKGSGGIEVVIMLIWHSIGAIARCAGPRASYDYPLSVSVPLTHTVTVTVTVEHHSS